MRNRAIAASLVLVTGLSALSVRLLYVQSWDRKFSKRQEINRFKMQKRIPATRGVIMDRHNRMLAQNRPMATLVADANHLHHEDNLTSAVALKYVSEIPEWESMTKEARRKKFRRVRSRVRSQMTPEQVRAEHLNYAVEVLEEKLGVSAEVLSSIISNGRTRIVVHEDIREDMAREIEEALGSRYIQGFSFERKQERFYPLGPFATHLLGFVTFDDKKKRLLGREGIERSMEDYLQGQDGERQLKRDENGMVMLTESASIRPPILGKHVQLALDSGVQAIAEEELDRALKELKTNRGCVVIVDPFTGDILGMASRPHYDPNKRENYLKGARNMAVQDQAELGSVMKIVSMSAALDYGVANRRTVVNCGHGQIERPYIVVRDHHKYGDLTFDGVLAKSSNPGAFLFAERVGRRGFYNMMEKFGFGRKTGFPLPKEASGVISNRTNPQTFATSTYGYGVDVSPLQVAMAYSALANGGVLMKPRLIKSVIANNGVLVEEREPEQVRRVVSERTAHDMRLSLEQVVLTGTGRRAAVPGHRVGGKTGTAWKYNAKKKGYDKDRYLVSFAGMAPVEKPSFVALVVIDDPTSPNAEDNVGGGTIAAPVFQRVAQRVLDLMNVEPTRAIELKPRIAGTND